MTGMQNETGEVPLMSPRQLTVPQWTLMIHETDNGEVLQAAGNWTPTSYCSLPSGSWVYGVRMRVERVENVMPIEIVPVQEGPLVDFPPPLPAFNDLTIGTRAWYLNQWIWGMWYLCHRQWVLGPGLMPIVN